MEIETEFEAEAIEKAFNYLIKRHGLLRTIFLEKENTQSVLENPPYYKVEVISCGETEKQWNENVLKLRERFSHHEYQFNTWPLFTFKVLQNDTRRMLMLSMSLLICDGASLQILIHEMYSYLMGEKQLEKLNYSFGEYSKQLAQHEKQEHHQYDLDKAYWLNKIEDFPDAPKLLFKQPIAMMKDYDVKRVGSTIKKDTWKRLKSCIRSKKISSSAMLCTLFAKVLSSWSNQKDLAIDLTVFERLPFHKDVDKLIGDFTKLIPLGISFKETIEETAKNVQIDILDGMEHLKFDGIDVMQELAKRNSKTGKAILPIVFTSMLFDTPINYFNKIGNITYAVSQTPQVYLDCQVMELEGELYISWDYAAELFDDGIIESMFKDFIELIEEFSFEEKLSLQKRIDTQWKTYNKEIKKAEEKTLIKYFIDSVKEYGNNIALSGDKICYTYEQMDKLSNKVARYLCAQGICGNNARVCVLAERKPETIITILGILKTGAAYVPISCDFPEERQQYICEDCNCKMILDTKMYFDGTLDKIEDMPIGICAQPDWLAYIIYTSGSTGKPKGVMINHRAACNTIDDVNEMIHLTQEDCLIGLSSLCFDLSVYDVFGVLSKGAKLAIIKDPRDISDIVQILKNERVTIWNSVPAILSALVMHLKNSREKDIYIKHILLSGDWIPLNLPSDTKELLGDVNITSLGGATEASIWSIYYPIKEVNLRWRSIPYGYPMKNQSMYVLGYDMNLCRPGIIGEIYIGGEGIASGYINDQEKTEKAFIETKNYGKIYKTGDLGIYHEEGYIEIIGRIDNQVKIRGYRIELAEIEMALQKYEAIKEAVVLALEGIDKRKVLVAYVVMRENRVFNQQEISKYLETVLPKYMVPGQFITLSELPRTPNGKINKEVLPKPNLQIETVAADTENLTQVQRKLIEIWQQEFQINNISIHDSFFSLGGDSITMMKMVESISHAFKVEISIEDILDCDCIKELSNLLIQKYAIS